jgi:hypothetical protein
VTVEHRARLEGVVKAALKEAAMGEPFGFAVNGPGVWPLIDNQGQQAPPGPAWFVLVTIRPTGVGEPDIGNGFPVPGVLPEDEAFRAVAKGLLERCRREREQGNRKVLAAVGEGPSMKLSDRPAA